MSKKIFEVDITSFDELQDLITEYFKIFSSLSQIVYVCFLIVSSCKYFVHSKPQCDDGDGDSRSGQ